MVVCAGSRGTLSTRSGSGTHPSFGGETSVEGDFVFSFDMF